jgi:ABC-2 type transport system permease protein
MLGTYLRSMLLLARMHLVELLGSKRLLFAGLLALLPALLALVVGRFAPDRPQFGPGMIHATATFMVLLQVVVPLGSLLVASGLIADEVEGRTITYLFTRSTPRSAVFLGRVIAVLLVLVPLFSLAAWATALAAAQREGVTFAHAERGMVYAAAAGTVVYSLIGAVLGVLSRRALLIALTYAFAVEVLIANYPGSTRRLSIQYWLRSLAIDQDVEPWRKLRALRRLGLELVEQTAAAERLAWIALALLAFGVWQVRRKEYVLAS